MLGARTGVAGFFGAAGKCLLKPPRGTGFRLLGEPFSQRNRLGRPARILVEQLRVCECLGDLEANRQRNAGGLGLIGLELESRKDKLLTAAERGHNRRHYEEAYERSQRRVRKQHVPRSPALDGERPADWCSRRLIQEMQGNRKRKPAPPP